MPTVRQPFRHDRDSAQQRKRRASDDDGDEYFEAERHAHSVSDGLRIFDAPMLAQLEAAVTRVSGGVMAPFDREMLAAAAAMTRSQPRQHRGALRLWVADAVVALLDGIETREQAAAAIPVLRAAHVLAPGEARDGFLVSQLTFAPRIPRLTGLARRQMERRHEAGGVYRVGLDRGSPLSFSLSFQVANGGSTDCVLAAFVEGAFVTHGIPANAPLFVDVLDGASAPATFGPVRFEGAETTPPNADGMQQVRLCRVFLNKRACERLTAGKLVLNFVVSPLSFAAEVADLCVSGSRWVSFVPCEPGTGGRPSATDNPPFRVVSWTEESGEKWSVAKAAYLRCRAMVQGNRCEDPGAPALLLREALGAGPLTDPLRLRTTLVGDAVQFSRPQFIAPLFEVVPVDPAALDDCVEMVDDALMSGAESYVGYLHDDATAHGDGTHGHGHGHTHGHTHGHGHGHSHGHHARGGSARSRGDRTGDVPRAAVAGAGAGAVAQPMEVDGPADGAAEDGDDSEYEDVDSAEDESMGEGASDYSLDGGDDFDDEFDMGDDDVDDDDFFVDADAAARAANGGRQWRAELAWGARPPVAVTVTSLVAVCELAGPDHPLHCPMCTPADAAVESAGASATAALVAGGAAHARAAVAAGSAGAPRGVRGGRRPQPDTDALGRAWPLPPRVRPPLLPTRDLLAPLLKEMRDCGVLEVVLAYQDDDGPVIHGIIAKRCGALAFALLDDSASEVYDVVDELENTVAHACATSGDAEALAAVVAARGDAVLAVENNAGCTPLADFLGVDFVTNADGGRVGPAMFTDPRWRGVIQFHVAHLEQWPARFAEAVCDVILKVSFGERWTTDEGATIFANALDTPQVAELCAALWTEAMDRLSACFALAMDEGDLVAQSRVSGSLAATADYLRRSKHGITPGAIERPSLALLGRFMAATDAWLGNFVHLAKSGPFEVLANAFGVLYRAARFVSDPQPMARVIRAAVDVSDKSPRAMARVLAALDGFAPGDNVLEELIRSCTAVGVALSSHEELVLDQWLAETNEQYAGERDALGETDEDLVDHDVVLSREDVLRSIESSPVFTDPSFIPDPFLLSVAFEGEQSRGPGVTRAALAEVCRALLDPAAKLFVSRDGGKTLYLGDAATVSRPLCHAFGRLIGIALMLNVPLEFSASPAFYRLFLRYGDDLSRPSRVEWLHETDSAAVPDPSKKGRYNLRRELAQSASDLVGGASFGVDELADVDPDLYRGLTRYMRDVTLDDDMLELLGRPTFSRVVRDGDSVRTVELCPGGAQMAVTEGNKHEYIALMVRSVLLDSVHESIHSIRDGFDVVIPDYLSSVSCRFVGERAFERRLCGDGDLTPAYFRERIRYENCSESDRIVRDLWVFVGALDQKGLQDLHEFLTGCRRAPAYGFSPIMHGVGDETYIFMVTVDATLTADALPKTSTCARILILPPYDTGEQLASKMRLALDACRDFGTD